MFKILFHHVMNIKLLMRYFTLFILSLESCCAGDNSHSTLNQPQLLNSHTVASGCLCWVVWF